MFLQHAVILPCVSLKTNSWNTQKHWEAANPRVKKQNRENKEPLATYSCCYHAACYYGACDWATWGRGSRCWALCPSVCGPHWASCHRRRRHRPGSLPPAAEKPTYVCYLAMIAQPETRASRGLFPNGFSFWNKLNWNKSERDSIIKINRWRNLKWRIFMMNHGAWQIYE